MKKIVNFLLFSWSLLSADLIVSAGGFDVRSDRDSYFFKDNNRTGERANITEVLQKKSKSVSSVSIWITAQWQEDWYSVKETQEEIIDKGYIPMFIFYYFADEITPAFVKEHEKEYFDTLHRFTEYLKKLDGQKIVVLNPEYNMFGVEKLDAMNDIFLKSFKVLREDSQVIVGPCVGDFGNYEKVNEPKEWVLFDASLNRAAKKADFIAFQEMRALTRNSESDMLRTPKRAYNISKYLYKKYKKPTLLAYSAISSYGKDGEQIQAEVYRGFLDYLPKMHEESKLLAFGTFHYFDYPGHVGYFKEAEEFFGLLRKDGTPKPSLEYFNNF